MWLEIYLKEDLGMSELKQKSFFDFCKDKYEIQLMTTDEIEELDMDEVEELLDAFEDVSLEVEDKFYKED